MGGKISKEEELDPWEKANQRRASCSMKKISNVIKFQRGVNVKLDKNGNLIGMPDVWVKLLDLDEGIVKDTIIETDSLPSEVVPLVNSEIKNYVKQSKPGKFIVTLPNNEEEK